MEKMEYIPEPPYELIGGKKFYISEEPEYELIGGEKYYMSPAPSATHGSIVMVLGTIFINYIDKNKLGAKVFGDNVDVYLSTKEHFKPDVSVVCKPDIIDWNGAIHGAPDLIVEVLSPSTMKNDYGLKKDSYEKYGVKEYWIVDPTFKTVEVYHLVGEKFKFAGKYELHGGATKIKVSIFEDLTVDIRKIFCWSMN